MNKEDLAEMERLRMDELEEDLSPGELMELAVEKATRQAENEVCLCV